jgi:hypothetical protein
MRAPSTLEGNYITEEEIQVKVLELLILNRDI